MSVRRKLLLCVASVAIVAMGGWLVHRMTPDVLFCRPEPRTIMSRDGERFAFVDNNSTKPIHLVSRQGREIGSLDAVYSAPLIDLKFRPGAPEVILGLSKGSHWNREADKGVVILQQIGSAAKGEKVTGFPALLWAIDVSQNGKLLAATGHDGKYDIWAGGSVRIIDLETRQVVWEETPYHTVTAVVFSPDGNTIALADYSDNVRVVEWASGKKLAVLPSESAKNYCFTHMAFSADGRLLMYARGKDLFVNQVADGRGVSRWSLDGVVHQLALSHDGLLLAVNADGVIYLFDTPTWQHLSSLSKKGKIGFCARSLFHYDGKCLVDISRQLQIPN